METSSPGLGSWLGFNNCGSPFLPLKAVLLPRVITLIQYTFCSGYCDSCGNPPMNETCAEEWFLIGDLIKPISSVGIY